MEGRHENGKGAELVEGLRGEDDERERKKKKKREGGKDY